MDTVTFNRQEKKYIISTKQYHEILKDINSHMIKDQYSGEDTYKISNIYYDTADNLVIKRSVSKPVFKEKLRLRGYGDLKADSLVFLEMKRKINGFVNKRRTRIACDEINELIIEHKLPEIRPYHNLQVLKEILYYIRKYSVKPAVFLSYIREAYYCKENFDLRITFDNHIITRRSELDVCKGIYGAKLLSDDQYVMEIKTNTNMPFWLIEILNKYKVYSTSFSKYGTEFYKHLNSLSNKQGGKEICGLNPYLKALR